MSLIPVLRSTARHRRESRPELAARLDETICATIRLATEIDTLRAERDALQRQLDAAGIELSGARHDADTARAEARRLEAALVATRAELANATAMSDLPPHTGSLTDRFEQGPVVRLGASPLATVPANAA